MDEHPYCIAKICTAPLTVQWREKVDARDSDTRIGYWMTVWACDDHKRLWDRRGGQKTEPVPFTLPSPQAS